MPAPTESRQVPPAPAPRDVAEAYVDGLVRLDPLTATSLGLPEGHDRLPDLSPAGQQRIADLRLATLADLDRAVAAAGGAAALPHDERRCARLLRERLEAAQALHEAGEGLRELGTLFSPVQSVRQVFTLMPLAEANDWDVVEARLGCVPEALEGYREALAEGAGRGLYAGPAQVTAVVEQLAGWTGDGPGRGWFDDYVRPAPETRRAHLAEAAAGATGAVAGLRDWLRDSYAPGARTGRDPVGEERYRRFARYWTGADLDLRDAYAWAWSEFAAIDAELRQEAERVLPGAGPLAAMAHLNDDGEAVHGTDQVRMRLQRMMDEAIEALDGTHFDLAGPLRTVEAMIAPAGSAAAPYYTRPSLDFARPGRTWLPTLGGTRFPTWNLVSTWYHEGVPGHHLQLAQWVLMAPRLTRFQTAVGTVGADVEGWALYAERLMDELGHLDTPGKRMGYLDAQQLRAVRVIVDIGMHLELELPHDQGVPEPFAPGERWTPALAREFFGRNSGRPPEFLDSELIRYLGGPGQAISYKLGERAWLAARDAARAAHGPAFDLKTWHMAALSAGSLGLDDLVREHGSV